jgi:hypothetical protein
MLPQLPEPVRHPSLVRAAVSPSAVAVTAAGAGIGVLADPHSAILAIVLGAGAWLGRMAVAIVSRGRRRLPVVTIDPFAVPEPWRQYVRDAVAARQRFDAALAQWPAGPQRDRLVLLQPRLWQGTYEVWSVAQRGAAMGATTPGSAAGGLVRPSAGQLSSELQRVQAERQRTPRSDRQAALVRSEEAIAAQLRAAHHSTEAQAEVLDRLRLLTARLDEVVTQLLELGLEQAGGPVEGPSDTVAGSVDALVEEIEALHEGLRQAGAASSGRDPSGEGGPTTSLALPPAPPPSPPAAS